MPKCEACGAEFAEGETHTCPPQGGGEAPAEGGDKPAEGGEEQKTE